MLKGLFIFRDSTTKIPKIQYIPLVFNIQNLSVVKDNLIAKILTRAIMGEKEGALKVSPTSRWT